MTSPRQSILLRLVLLTSSLLTLIFAGTGLLLTHNISERATQTVQQEVASSFQAYEALWREHTGSLQKISAVISGMADIRSAFLTHDPATIQDAAQELWSRASPGHSLLSVTDGAGRVIANVGADTPFTLGQNLDLLHRLETGFPRQQFGFLQDRARLFQIVVTPVYVEGSTGQQLLVVLITGFQLDRSFLHSLKLASGGSDLIFQTQAGTQAASTIVDPQATATLRRACANIPTGADAVRVNVQGIDYLALNRALPSLLPEDRAGLCIVRSLVNSDLAVRQLRTWILYLWLTGLVAAILCTYAVVRRILQPVAVLDRAAAEIAKGNYQIQVKPQGADELGRLAASFNTMCASLEGARAELIRHERLSSVARLATFVVHDLRNPLASIYAGAEMLVDNDLPEKQVKRLARNMYDASRGVMQILSELLATARNKVPETELCSLQELVQTAWNALAARGLGSNIDFKLNVPAEVELPLGRAAMERVFHNLLENAIEAIQGRGVISVWLESQEHCWLLHVADSGRGIHPELRPILFQPFASKGNLEGLGLGLALSRQTLVAHGGDLWADFDWPEGSHFLMRLPSHQSPAQDCLPEVTLTPAQQGNTDQ